MSDYVTVRMKREEYRELESLRVELAEAKGNNRRLANALAECRERIEEAERLINAAVGYMSPEQVGRWQGVRAWLEEDDE